MFAIALCITGAIFYLAAITDSFPGDEWAINAFQGTRNLWLDRAALAASYVAGFWFAIGSILALSFVLWVGRRRADAVVILMVLFLEGINLGLKELVGRARPELSLLASSPDNNAFPSGHAFHVLLLFGLLIFILGQTMETRWLRVSTQGLLGVSILACGASRVYLGIHWPSDVLGGYLLAGLVLVALLWVRKRLIKRGLQ